MPNTETAVLLVNLGSPNSTSDKDVAAYLKEFLSDGRVIEVNPKLWSIILNLMILPRRKKASAKRYDKVWMPEGSPLLVHTRNLARKLEERFSKQGLSVLVRGAMRYGDPNQERAVKDLHERLGVQKLLVVPLYPQYSATTTASVMDKLGWTLNSMRSQPHIRVLRDYHDDLSYIEALATSIESLWLKKGSLGEDGKLLLSFHGMPLSYCQKGDPYEKQVRKTAELLKKRLDLPEEKLEVSFQSRFGKEVWLQPYTVSILERLAKEGIKRVDVICPGFACDCLETLEEINEEARSIYLAAGGTQFNYIECLNDQDQWAEKFYQIINHELGLWLKERSSSD